MRSWKTTLGGSLAGLGTFLWGVPVALMQFKELALSPEITKWCIVIGLAASAGGVFFTGLFGRDNNVSSEDVKRVHDKAPTPPPPHPGIDLKLILLSVGLAGLMGCTTSQPNTPDLPRRIASLVNLGTVTYLSQRPEARPSLERIYAALQVIQSGPGDPVEFGAILRENDRIFAAVFEFAMDELQAAGVTVDTPDLVKQWIKPIRLGLARGLGLPPPVK